MSRLISNNLKVAPQFLVWMLVIVGIVVIGVSMVADLSGVSPADQFVVARWGFPGLRIYLWLEGAAMVGLVSALGAHVISAGLAVTRGEPAAILGDRTRLHPGVPRQFGYAFVVIGSALVALSITTLVLLNSCRYMRII